MLAKQLLTRSLIGSAAALFTSVALLAQAGQQPNMPSQQPQAPSATNPMNNPPTAPPEDYAAQAFVSKAIQGDDTQVQLGQLAQQKSQTPDIKKFGQTMIADHTQINEKLMVPAAKQLGSSAPKGPSKKDKKEIARLQSMSGADFDKAYLATAWKQQQAYLKSCKSEAEATQNPTMKLVAQESGNVLQKQLQLIQVIAKNHNIPLTTTEKNVSRMP